MRTLFLSLLLLQHLLGFENIPSSTTQLLVVTLDHPTQTHAQLQSFEKIDQSWKEVFAPVEVVIGRNGARSDKHEGDGASPLGLFALSEVFGYAPSPITAKMPYIAVTPTLHYVDDAESAFYNQILEAREGYESHEVMLRPDGLYRLGVVVDYNPKRIAGRGSCIFIHIMRPDQSPTAGCTAMKASDLKKIILWLDQTKKPNLLLRLKP